MNFCEALEILRNGGTVKRSSWGNMFLELFNDVQEVIFVKRSLDDKGFPWLNTQEDIISNDWIEVSLTSDNCVSEKLSPLKKSSTHVTDDNCQNGKINSHLINQMCKVYCICYQGIEDNNDTLCIYVEAINLIGALRKINDLSLPRLANMRFIGVSLTDSVLLNESKNMQSYELYSIQTQDKEFLCSINGMELTDLIIGLGLATYDIIGVSFIDEAGKYLLVKNGK